MRLPWAIFITVDNTFFNRYRFLILYAVPDKTHPAPVSPGISRKLKPASLMAQGYRSRFKNRKMPLYEFTQKDLSNEKPLNHI